MTNKEHATHYPYELYNKKGHLLLRWPFSYYSFNYSVLANLEVFNNWLSWSYTMIM